MGIKRAFGKVIGSFNPVKFVGANRIHQNSVFIKELCHDVFLTKNPSAGRSQHGFEEQMQAAGVTEADLLKRIESSYRFLIMGLCFVGLLALYAVYLFYKAQFFSAVVTLLLSLLMGSYAWREHFLLTRLKHRLTTLTVKQWFNLLIKK